MKKISPGRQKKEAIVNKLFEKAQKAKAMVLSNYQGMTHQQLEELKRAVKKVDAELVVTKNTLLKRALEQTQGEKNFNPDLIGASPTASLFIYNDIIAPIKEIAKSIKILKLPLIKIGVLDRQILNAEQIIKFSSLPSREILIAQVVGTMKFSIYGLHRVLSWNLSKLAIILTQIKNQKEKGVIKNGR